MDQGIAWLPKPKTKVPTPCLQPRGNCIDQNLPDPDSASIARLHTIAHKISGCYSDCHKVSSSEMASIGIFLGAGRRRRARSNSPVSQQVTPRAVSSADGMNSRGHGDGHDGLPTGTRQLRLPVRGRTGKSPVNKLMIQTQAGRPRSAYSLVCLLKAGMSWASRSQEFGFWS